MVHVSLQFVKSDSIQFAKKNCFKCPHEYWCPLSVHMYILNINEIQIQRRNALASWPNKKYDDESHQSAISPHPSIC